MNNWHNNSGRPDRPSLFKRPADLTGRAGRTDGRTWEQFSNGLNYLKGLLAVSNEEREECSLFGAAQDMWDESRELDKMISDEEHSS